MSGRDFSYTLTVNSATEKAFADICRVSKWWATDLSGRSEKTGDAFTVRFGDTWVTFRVARAVPNSEIVWEVTDCHLSWLPDKTEWKGTQIVWKIAADGAKTEIRFTHVGLVPEIECYKDCSLGWSAYLQESLQKLVQENRGFRISSERAGALRKF